jgi:hypothetical protein
MIFVSPEVEIGEITCEVVGGSSVRIPIEVRLRVLCGEERGGIWSFILIWVVKTIVTFGSNMTNSIADLTHRTVGSGWEGWASTSPATTTAKGGARMGREMSMRLFDRQVVALSNISRWDREITNWMEVLKTLFMSEQIAIKNIKGNGFDASNDSSDKRVIFRTQTSNDVGCKFGVLERFIDSS